jgi:hypothetical protein
MITKESCGELRLGVLLSRAAPALAKGEAPLSVNYHTADGTAEAGTDYIGKNCVMMNAQHQSKLLELLVYLTCHLRCCGYHACVCDRVQGYPCLPPGDEEGGGVRTDRGGRRLRARSENSHTKTHSLSSAPPRFSLRVAFSVLMTV